MSQWARVVTEAWATRELYCIACTSNAVTPHGANTQVEDYHCKRCNRRLQLKAKSGRLGKQVSNSAYETKMKAIRANRAPDYGFLSYDREALVVTDLMVVPGHFLTSSVVSARPPLPPSARRAGWIDSNIHLDRIPLEGKLQVIQKGRALPRSRVRKSFQKMEFLRELPPEGRGWISDVLRCVERLDLQPRDQFRLDQMYAFEGELARLHPRNTNIKPKIRQQLQVLERKGVIEFLGRGHYIKV